MDMERLFSTHPSLKAIFNKNFMFEVVSMPKGKILLEQGESPQFFYVLLSGTLKVEHVIDDGRFLFIAYLYPYDYLGDLEFSLDCTNTHQVTVVSPSSLIKITKTEYMRLMVEDAQFGKSINLSLARKLKSTTAHFVNHVYKPLKDRLIAIIYREIKSAQFQRDFSVSISVPREQLAEQLGVTIRSITRVIKELKEHGMIQTNKKKIIVNETGLYLIKRYMEDNNQSF
jgi:CRP-like cAMP-binding protein